MTTQRRAELAFWMAVLAAGLLIAVSMSDSASALTPRVGPTNPHIAALQGLITRDDSGPAGTLPTGAASPVDPTPAATARPAVAAVPAPTGHNPSVVVAPKTSPIPHPLAGWATYYIPTVLYEGAAGPALRHALTVRYGRWRGMTVTVDGPRGSHSVLIMDWCACGVRHGLPTLIDLSGAAWDAICGGPPGVCRVTIP